MLSKQGDLLGISHSQLASGEHLTTHPDSPPRSPKSAARVSEAVGDDATKLINGGNRHLTIDPLAVVLPVLVTAANVGEGEGEGAKRVLKLCQPHRHSGDTSAHTLGRWWLGRQFLHQVGDKHLPVDCPGSLATQATQRVCAAQTALGGKGARWVG